MNPIEYTPTNIQSNTDSHDILWNQYENGILTREEYHRETWMLLQRARKQSDGCGTICVVNYEDMVVEATYSGSL